MQWIPDSLRRKIGIPDSRGQLNSGFQSPAFLDSTNKSFPDWVSGSNNFPDFGIRITLSCGNRRNKAPECWVCLRYIKLAKCYKQSQGKQYSAAFYSKNYREYGNRPNLIIVYLKRLLTLKLSCYFLTCFQECNLCGPDSDQCCVELACLPYFLFIQNWLITIPVVPRLLGFQGLFIKSCYQDVHGTQRACYRRKRLVGKERK